MQGNRALILKEWASPAAVVANENIIREHAEDLKRFLQAYIEAFALYARDPNRFNALYSEDSRLPLPNEVYQSMAAYEPNLSIRDASSVNILLDISQQETYQHDADTALRIGIIRQAIDVRSHIDLQTAEAAMSEIKGNRAQ